MIKPTVGRKVWYRPFGRVDALPDRPSQGPRRCGHDRSAIMNDAIETEIQADIAAEIASEHYFIASDALQLESAVHVHKGGWIIGSSQLLTICIMQLVNGFTVTGESACASAENFDAEIGRKIARENAISKVWPLLGFRLRDKLAGAQA